MAIFHTRGERDTLLARAISYRWNVPAGTIVGLYPSGQEMIWWEILRLVER